MKDCHGISFRDQLATLWLILTVSYAIPCDLVLNSRILLCNIHQSIGTIWSDRLIKSRERKSQL